MTARAFQLLLGFTLLGLGASTASTVVHYRLVQNPAYTSFCDVNATVSCTEAYLSRFGSIAGIPVALIGVLWFALVLLLVLAGRGASTPVRESVPGYIFAMSTVGLAVSLYLGYVSLVILKAVCLLCVATYVAVVGLFITSGTATSFPMTTLPRRATRDLRSLVSNPAGLALSALFIAGATLAVMFFPREAVTTAAAQAAPLAADTRTEFDRWWESNPRVKMTEDNAGAAVLIVAFHDFQCPACKQAFLDNQTVLQKYQTSHPGAVRYVEKDYPLDPECNANAPNGVHLAACEAAVAVRLAKRTDKGEALERHLFTNQQLLSPAWVRQAARDVAGIQDFGSEYARILEGVKADIALGNLLGVQATPTFFINGVKVQGGLQPQFFDAAIAYELKKAGK